VQTASGDQPGSDSPAIDWGEDRNEGPSAVNKDRSSAASVQPSRCNDVQRRLDCGDSFESGSVLYCLALDNTLLDLAVS
jgi:hypothetical protein